MTLWYRLVGDRPIVTRLVLAVAVTMAAVLLLAGAFVFWRVSYALNRQLDQDLDAYQQVVQDAVARGTTRPSDTPGLSYQIYDRRGDVIAGNATIRLADHEDLTRATKGAEVREDVGDLFPVIHHPYKLVVESVDSPDGTVLVASAISKNKHNEALRELLLQLALADLVTLVAASYVGYRTARAALDPVERYRLAAEQADGAQLLPVSDARNDEVTRLGHTFNALLERIARANQRERQFLADAAHELRSPLALMRTELEVAALRSRDDETTGTMLASLSDQVERLITLSNALLDLEEVHASGLAPGDPVDVGRLVVDVADRFAAEARNEARRVEASAPPGLTVPGNRHWLELALANLVANALRHGAGTIRLTATSTDEGVRLAVIDEGTGFPADFVDQAFDRFSRGDTSRSTRGTGLGLALVQAVAEVHGGTAVITGAQVAMDLPAVPAPGSDDVGGRGPGATQRQ